VSSACNQAWMEGGAALAAHAQTCEACRRALDAMSEEPAPAPEVLSAIGAAARQELAAHPRARAWWPVPVAIAVINAAAVVFLARAGQRGSVAPGASELGWFGGALVVALATLGVPLALAPGRGLRRFVAPLLVLTGAVIVLGGNAGLVRAPFGAGWTCAASELAASVLPLAAAIWALCGAAFSVWRAVLACAAAACVGLTALFVGCGDGTMLHLAVFHLVPGLALAAAGVALRSRLPSSTFAP
jgi:hypothetical protein